MWSYEKKGRTKGIPTNQASETQEYEDRENHNQELFYPALVT